MMSQPLINQMITEFRYYIHDLLRRHSPLAVAMVVREHHIIDPPWWAPWRKPKHEYRNTEIGPRHQAGLVDTGHSYRVETIPPNAAWDWNYDFGGAVFQEFVVYLNDGRILARGGALNAKPTAGCTVSPHIEIHYR